MTPEISFFCPGIRPENWPNILRRLNTDPPYEVIFVGPYPPTSVQMPPHARYIYSEVKPEQARMIAIREAQANLVGWLNDDFLYWHPNTVGLLLEAWHHTSLLGMVMPNFMSGYPSWTADGPPRPYLPFGEVFHRGIFLERGGYDKRFVSMYACNDYAMRLQSDGDDVTVAHDVRLQETMPGKLWDDVGWQDRMLLDELWVEGYERTTPHRKTWEEPSVTLRPNRKDAVQPYDLDAPDLLWKHQGPKGRWKDLCEPCYQQRKQEMERRVKGR